MDMESFCGPTEGSTRVTSSMTGNMGMVSCTFQMGESMMVAGAMAYNTEPPYSRVSMEHLEQAFGRMESNKNGLTRKRER